MYATRPLLWNRAQYTPNTQCPVHSFKSVWRLFSRKFLWAGGQKYSCHAARASSICTQKSNHQTDLNEWLGHSVYTRLTHGRPRTDLGETETASKLQDRKELK